MFAYQVLYNRMYRVEIYCGRLVMPGTVLSLYYSIKSTDSLDKDMKPGKWAMQQYIKKSIYMSANSKNHLIKFI